MKGAPLLNRFCGRSRKMRLGAESFGQETR